MSDPVPLTPNAPDDFQLIKRALGPVVSYWSREAATQALERVAAAFEELKQRCRWRLTAEEKPPDFLTVQFVARGERCVGRRHGSAALWPWEDLSRVDSSGGGGFFSDEHVSCWAYLLEPPPGTLR